VPDGYAGFDWHGATNDEVLDASYHSTCGIICTGDGYTSAWITEMSRPAAFDLLSMKTQRQPGSLLVIMGRPARRLYI
jgi:hypothetical protein